MVAPENSRGEVYRPIINYDEADNELRIGIEGGTIIGKLQTGNDPYAHLERVTVYQGQGQGQGKGAYLVSSFAREVAIRGATKLYAACINPVAARIFGRIFGDSNITFVDHRNGVDFELPITALQAAGSIERANEIGDGYDDELDLLPEGFDESIRLFVDLTNPELRLNLGLDFDLPRSIE